MSLPVGNVNKLHSELPLRDKGVIAETLEILDLPSDQYFIVGGANLVLRGIKRTTRDIDALCSNELFEELAANPDVKLKYPPKSAIAQGATNKTIWLEREGLDIPFTATTSMGDGYFPQSFEEYRDQVEIVEGFPCVNLEIVRASKRALQRPYPSSDLFDLDAISFHLGESIEEPLPMPTIIAPHIFS
jgi:hypothetical protein